MKKNIKKQSNRKSETSSKKKKIVLLKAKKTVAKKITTKVRVASKSKKQVKSKTKSALKNRKVAVLKQKVKKNIRKSIKKSAEKNNGILTFGDIELGDRKILLLIIAIILVASVLIVQSMTAKVSEKIIEKPAVAGVATSRNVVLEKQINDMVAGYPIEKMTRFIAKQDPKVAAFLVAIAKKESAWGDRKPVLNGEDCYNYWGFRLKSDRMGSGGHTCFDSPEEAVEIVGSRLNHLVNEEKIDTPKEMVIWKCGYDCDGPAAAGSQKWIKDVDYYYKQMIN